MNKTEKLAIVAVVLYTVSQAVNSLRHFETSLVDKFDWTFRQLAFLSVPVFWFLRYCSISVSLFGSTRCQRKKELPLGCGHFLAWSLVF